MRAPKKTKPFRLVQELTSEQIAAAMTQSRRNFVSVHGEIQYIGGMYQLKTDDGRVRTIMEGDADLAMEGNFEMDGVLLGKVTVSLTFKNPPKPERKPRRQQLTRHL